MGDLAHLLLEEGVIASISSTANGSVEAWENLRGASVHQLGEELGEDLHAVVIDEL